MCSPISNPACVSIAEIAFTEKVPSKSAVKVNSLPKGTGPYNHRTFFTSCPKTAEVNKTNIRMIFLCNIPNYLYCK